LQQLRGIQDLIRRYSLDVSNSSNSPSRWFYLASFYFLVLVGTSAVGQSPYPIFTFQPAAPTTADLIIAKVEDVGGGLLLSVDAVEVSRVGRGITINTKYTYAAFAAGGFSYLVTANLGALPAGEYIVRATDQRREADTPYAAPRLKGTTTLTVSAAVTKHPTARSSFSTLS
jgi:hypothetical protein